MRTTTLKSNISLPPGTRINNYKVVSELGSGGFGITYKAFDPELQTHVAIKEYLPIELAVRNSDNISVTPRSEKVIHDYQFGLKGFLKEARTLAKFRDHRIVRVLQFMEANGTAYLVMEYEEGESLHTMIAHDPTPFSEQKLLRLLTQTLEALSIVHHAGILHRDVKPANIYIRTDGSPVLLDFGSARYSLGEETRLLTSIVTPGYAPFEQYLSSEKQGPWTDIYGVGATFYRLVTGKRPIEATERIAAISNNTPEPNPPATDLTGDEYSKEFLGYIDWMLKPRSEERPQTADTLLTKLATLRELPSKMPTDIPSFGALILDRSHRRKLAIGMGIAVGLIGLGFSLANIGQVDTKVEENLFFIPPTSRTAEENKPVVAKENTGMPEEKNKQQINTLLNRAEQALEDLRLTTPEGNSAFDYYQQVRRLDPENPTVTAGIKIIINQYIAFATTSWQNGNRNQKDAYLDRATGIDPNDPDLIAARTRLAILPTQQGRQPIRRIRFPNIRAAKIAYRERQIDKREYSRIERYYVEWFKKKVGAIKALYRSGGINKQQYRQRIRAAEHKYKGSGDRK